MVLPPGEEWQLREVPQHGVAAMHLKPRPPYKSARPQCSAMYLASNARPPPRRAWVWAMNSCHMCPCLWQQLATWEHLDHIYPKSYAPPNAAQVSLSGCGVADSTATSLAANAVELTPHAQACSKQTPCDVTGGTWRTPGHAWRSRRMSKSENVTSHASSYRRPSPSTMSGRFPYSSHSAWCRAAR